jgi:hypothetical protein
MQNLHKTARLGFQETQNFEKYLGECLHLPSICIQWCVKNVIRGEVDNIFCFAVGIAVYDEFFSSMCAS